MVMVRGGTNVASRAALVLRGSEVNYRDTVTDRAMLMGGWCVSLTLEQHFSRLVNSAAPPASSSSFLYSSSSALDSSRMFRARAGNSVYNSLPALEEPPVGPLGRSKRGERSTTHGFKGEKAAAGEGASWPSKEAAEEIGHLCTFLGIRV